MVSDVQYERLLNRVTKLEERVNDLITAHTRFVTLTQVNQLLVVQQTQNQALQEQVDSLNTRVVGLEEEANF